MNVARPLFSAFAVGIALGRHVAPSEALARITFDALTAWFAHHPHASARCFSARVTDPRARRPRPWRLAQGVLDAEGRVVAARWIEAPSADDQVMRLHPRDSFVWWHE